MENLRLFLLPIVVAVSALCASVHADDNLYDKSNCRRQSSILKNSDGTPVTTAIESVDGQTKERLPGAAGDVNLEACTKDTSAFIIGSVVDSQTNMTAIEDDGFVEFSEPGRPGESTRCKYHVDKGVPVSEILLEYIGVKPSHISNFGPLEKQISDEGKRIVKIECDAVS